MKNGLQYIYSISVFMGVLLTAYFMMNSVGNARLPLRAFQAPGMRSEAAVEPALQQLMEMEQVLMRLRKEREQNKRFPSDLNIANEPDRH